MLDYVIIWIGAICSPLMVGMASKHIFKFEGSIDVANLFIEASQISFFSGLFVMHIGDLTPISCVIPIHLYISTY